MKPVLSAVEAAAVSEFDIVAEAEAILVDALFADIVRQFVAVGVAKEVVASGARARANWVERTNTAEVSGSARTLRTSGRSPPDITI